MESGSNDLFFPIFLSSIVRPIPSYIVSLPPQTRLNQHPLSPCRLGSLPSPHLCPHNPSHNWSPLGLSGKTKHAVYGCQPPAMGLNFQTQGCFNKTFDIPKIRTYLSFPLLILKMNWLEKKNKTFKKTVRKQNLSLKPPSKSNRGYSCRTHILYGSV